MDFNLPTIPEFKNGINKSNFNKFISFTQNNNNQILSAFFYLYRKSKGEEFSFYEIEIIRQFLKNNHFLLKMEKYEIEKNKAIPTIDDKNRMNTISNLLDEFYLSKKIMAF
jgi:hypothetical protein